jgi:23S rRNA (cytosine1962-C5)-methyltransferase
VEENGTWYALDLQMNQDASLYLDTRNLRRWLTDHMSGKTVLNTFAYTGSLGVAACAGGATHAVQLDLSRQFLTLGKTSYTLNGFPIHKADFIAGDFWSLVNQFKRRGERFDCVVVDPPFFSETAKGTLDLNTDSARLINKVRPLVNDGGWLVSVNNALYMSGKEYMETLEGLCADGYLKIAELIPAPEDFTGYVETRKGKPITDPSPFNHSTKIAVLEVRRKGGG